MEDKKVLNNEELEKVVGGTGESNQIALAVETAIQEIKIEIDTINDIIERSGERTTARNSLLQNYGDMLSKFASLQVIISPTIADVNRAFPSDYVMGLRVRAREIYDDFRRAIQCM